ncbi:uncharacterized protein [Ranitomeya imitator]|uniref:uncharacterized protein n=1 Tax=Ranitomeya imitator TaxID=111125 RepID=UPI0037E837F8
MLPELIDARVLSILNSMTPENSVDRFCRSLSPCLSKVPDGRQERVRAAVLTLIAANQGEQEPNQVLGPIEQWRPAQHQIQMPSATSIPHAQNVGTQQSQQMPAPSSMLPPPAFRHCYTQMSAPVWFPPARCYTHDYGQMSDPASVPYAHASTQQYGQMSDPDSVPHACASTEQYWQRSDPSTTYRRHSETMSSSMSGGDSSGAHFAMPQPYNLPSRHQTPMVTQFGPSKRMATGATYSSSQSYPSQIIDSQPTLPQPQSVSERFLDMSYNTQPYPHLHLYQHQFYTMNLLKQPHTRPQCLQYKCPHHPPVPNM